MKTVLALICSFALIGLAGAAQQDDQNNPKNKKGQKQPVQSSQPVVTPKGTGKAHVYSNQGVQTPHNSYGNPQLQTHHNKTQFNKQPAVQSTAKTTALSKTTAHNNGGVAATTFKAKHFNLPNKPNSNIPAVKFNQNFHIAGSQNWKGQKYVVFRNYHPQWHDQGWWRSHHNHIVFVSGGWYFWDGGYYYPAWGYAPDAYYAYDGPIYAGSEETDPGQVVANVQSALQEQGFYQGEVDGILGPQTRAALAEYQSKQGMEPTGAIDEPTLESLNMS
jgi:Putative peptidoglycan binding domain